MLTIIEQKDLSAYAELLRGLPIPAGTVLHLTEAKDGDAVKGYIAYSYEPEQVVIYTVADGGDWDQCDGLVRSVLFKAELKGIEQAFFPVEDAAMLQRLQKLGFVKNAEKMLYSIADIMESCKKCGENQANT